MDIEYRPRFEKEIRSICDYIAQYSKRHAKEFLSGAKSHIERLLDNPYMGRIASEQTRELIYKGYTIPYLIDGDKVVVLGIFNMNEWDVE